MLYIHLLLFFLAFQLLEESAASVLIEQGDENCSAGHHQVVGIIDQSSRVGREQKLAMVMAFQDIHSQSACFKLDLHIKDSNGSAIRAASAAMELVDDNRVLANIGTLTVQEAAVLYEFEKLSKETPFISITPTAKLLPTMSLTPPSFIQMSNDITNHMQCIAAIVSHYRWQRITAIYEHSNTFGTDANLITQLSDALQLVDSTIEQHSAFPPISSLANPAVIIEQQLEKLRNNNNRVFIVVQSSLQFVVLLFDKAKQMGLMEKECVWIISDDIASLIDSLGQSVISNMQGVIGFRTYFVDSGVAYKNFKLRFQQKYRSEYRQEDGHSNPSIYALRAYDAAWAIAKGIQGSKEKENESKDLLKSILASNFIGLSGNVNFNNGRLAQLPAFKIINVIGRSYRDNIALWSQESGFVINLNTTHDHGMKRRNKSTGVTGNLDSIYWPGGLQTVPKGWTLGEKAKRLKVGVPARGAFNNFVKVKYDHTENRISVTGFSINVFKAALKQLPYYLPYDFVPYNGSYDQMVVEVHNKTFDAAVGDTDILAYRYELADFSQPYIESGLVMVVKVKQYAPRGRFEFLKAFKWKMWVLMAAMSIATGIVVWLTEHAENNPDFGGSIFNKFGRMLWFSITVLSFTQRESIRSNLSRFVLGMWFFVIVVVTACFTAVLTSTMTVTQLQPNIIDVEHLQKINAVVGCNGNSFIVDYLVNVLHFHRDNVMRINSFKDYPEAFERRDIAAAFLVAPHAKVFLAEYCHGYTTAGTRFSLGGFGFAFQKGSLLVKDISEAILKVTQTGEINQLEREMLSFANCPSSARESNVPSLGLGPFSGLFIVSGSISAMAFVITVARMLQRHWLIYSSIRDELVQSRMCRWVSTTLSRIRGVLVVQLSRGSKDNQINVCADMPQHAAGIELAQHELAYILEVWSRLYAYKS